jgi:hypothetical protein
MNSLRIFLLPAAIAALLVLSPTNGAFAQAAPAAASAARGGLKTPQWQKYQQDVIAREKAEHAQRVKAARDAALKRQADAARRLQAQRAAAARAMPAKPSVAPKASAAPPPMVPVIAQPTPQPVKPPVAMLPPAERKAYETRVINRETQEQAERAQAARTAPLKRQADEARQVQAQKEKAARSRAQAEQQALEKEQAAQAYEKSVTRRELAEHAQHLAMARPMPVKPPAVAPWAPAGPPATPIVKPPVVAVASAAPAAPAPTAAVKPPVAATPLAERKAYETRVIDQEALEHAQRLQIAIEAAAKQKVAEQQPIVAENQKRAAAAARPMELAQREQQAQEHPQRLQTATEAEAKQKVAGQQPIVAENQKTAALARRLEIAQRENTLKTREVEEHRRREQARQAAEAARKAATYNFGIQ